MRHRLLWLLFTLSFTGFSVSVLDYEALSVFTVFIPGESLGLSDVNLFYFDRQTIERTPDLFAKRVREDAVGAILLLSSRNGDGLPPLPVSFEYDITPITGLAKETGYPLSAFVRFFVQGEELGGEDDCGDCGKPVAHGMKTLTLRQVDGVLGLPGVWIDLFNDHIDPFSEHKITLDWFINGKRLQQEVAVDPENAIVSVCYWNPALIIEIAQAFYGVTCVGVESPLLIRIQLLEEPDRVLTVSLDGVQLLSSVKERPEELIAFHRQFLLGQKLLVSHPDFLRVEDLKRHLEAEEPVPVLLWKIDPVSNLPQVLWNVVLITNGYTAIDSNNLMLAPLLRVCGCQ